jgi:hypothetical protein
MEEMVIVPRKLLLAMIFILAAVGVSAANDIYIAQTAQGSGNGSDCADAYAYTFFNSSGNWGNGSNQIGPDTIVHACGTFTGAANGTMLQFQGSGTSGHPITLLGETGALFTAPYWNPSHSSGGAINTNGQSYLVINGGPTCGWSAATQTLTPCNMTIENSDNGDPPKTYQSVSVQFVISAGSHDVDLKNTTLQNAYYRPEGSTYNISQSTFSQINAVWIEYSGGGTNNITLDHNIVTQAPWSINSGNGTMYFGPGNDVSLADHMIANAGTTFYLFGNHFHDTDNWSNSAGHHDGYHCYGHAPGSQNVSYVYNNQFDGLYDSRGTTGDLYYESGASACLVANAQGMYIFNNVFILNGNIDATLSMNGNTGGNMQNTFVANNTAIGAFPGSGNDTSEGYYLFERSSGITFYNNTSGGLRTLIAEVPGNTWTAAPDYNFYENCPNPSGAPCFAARGVSSNSFATWQTGGNDLHGGANLGSTNYFGLNPACTIHTVGQNCAPVAGSPLIGAGKNLYSACNGQPNPGLGALCFDITGAPRPSSGAWDVGAFQYSNDPPPSPPTGLTAVVQ